MNGLALCAGVGGLELGLHLALDDYRTVCFVEREAHAAACLVARMAEGIMAPAPVWDDLGTFDGEPWRGCVDLLSAGYPCQPFSFAGQRGGVDDPRHLWPHVARIARGAEPGLVFIENVPGHLSLGFDHVCRDLSDMGYRIAAGLFSASEVGATHRRLRLFALAHRAGERLGEARGPGEQQREPGLADAVAGGFGAIQRHDLRQLVAHGRGSALAHAEDGESQGRHRPIAERGDELPTWPPSPTSGDWGSIDPAFWPATELGIRRVADGLAARVDRLRAGGNGVVALVAAHAFRTLAAALDDRVIRLVEAPR